VHANLLSVAHGWRGSLDGRFYQQLQSSREVAEARTVDLVVIGLWIYSALVEILGPFLKEPEEQSERVAAVAAMVKRLCQLYFELWIEQKSIPSPFVIPTVTGDLTFWEDKFRESLNRTPDHTCPECNHEF
jgi:hypothetical protein